MVRVQRSNHALGTRCAVACTGLRVRSVHGKGLSFSCELGSCPYIHRADSTGMYMYVCTRSRSTSGCVHDPSIHDKLYWNVCSSCGYNISTSAVCVYPQSSSPARTICDHVHDHLTVPYPTRPNRRNYKKEILNIKCQTKSTTTSQNTL